MESKWRGWLALSVLAMVMVVTVLLIVKQLNVNAVHDFAVAEKANTQEIQGGVVAEIREERKTQSSVGAEEDESEELQALGNEKHDQDKIGVKDEQGEKDMTTVHTQKELDFKIVGYYPEWKPEKANTIQYDKLTHINYSFAIPTKESEILPLENPSLAKEIIKKGHEKGVKVLIAVGGWEYKGTPLEMTFIEATNTQEKIEKLGDSILKVVDTYGFDGVDMDWEHPRTDGNSKYQYEALMLYLRKGLDEREKLLTSAVVAGVTPDGNILWDAAGHTDTVLEAVDWVNVMAYDGGDGERHSDYDFAVDAGLYWRDTRGMGKDKVVVGVPFYGRPGWKTYEELLMVDSKAHTKDSIEQMYYNGQETIKKKTEWAIDEVAGIMIWELAGDTTDMSKSLLATIYETVAK